MKNKLNEVYYCKDCKHCVIDDDYDIPNKKSVEFEDCPISDWFESVWYVDSDFYEYGGYICDFDTLQPPPNCNCFEPKEGKCLA